MIIPRIKFLLLAGFLAIAIQFARGAETPTLIDRPNADSGPTQISVAIWFVDVSSIDSAQQSFTADVVVVLRWKDPRLAHVGGGVALYPLDQIWNPRVVVVNETNSISHRFPDSVEVGTDGTVIYRQRLVGSFAQALVLKSFPFDKQVFRVQLAAVKYNPSEVSLVPDEKWIAAGINQAAGISPSITLPDWTVEKWDKVILPLVLIVMMSWAVFWIDPATSNSQISVAVTSMLTLIAYRFAVDSQLPRLPYMTRLDSFFLTSTILVFFSLIEVLVTTILDNNQQTERAKKIDRYCRVIFPAIFAISSIAIFVHPGS